MPHGRGALLAMRGNDLSESWGPMRAREEAEAVLVLFRKLRAQSVDSDHRAAKRGSDVIHCTNPLTHYLRLGGAVILVGCAALVAQASMNGADQALVLLGLLTPFLLLAAIFCTWSERYRVELSGRVETVSRSLWWIERREARQFTRLRVDERPSGYGVYGEQAPGEWVVVIPTLSRSCAARLGAELRTWCARATSGPDREPPNDH